MEHEPVTLRASPQALLALTDRITAFRVEELPSGSGDVTTVWFQADQLYRVTVDILNLAFMFEVFTLAVKTPDEVFEIMQANAPQLEKSWAAMREAGFPIPPIDSPTKPSPGGELTPWPFGSWRLDVLKRTGFLVGPEHLPETVDGVRDYFDSLPAGEAPNGSKHRCLTAIGLLFTSDDNRRFLVVADGMPGFMRVTEDEEDVQSHLRECIVVPAAEYASTLNR